MLAAVTGVAGRAHAAAPICADQVAERFAARDFVAAARQAERCWDDTPDALMLFFAGQAWEQAGHFAHAVRSYRRFLVAPLSELAARAEAFLRDVMGRTGGVELRSESDLGIDRVEAVYLDSQRDPLVQQADELGAPPRLHLDPGRWEVRVFARDGWDERHEVAVAVDRPVTVNDFETRRRII